MISGGARQRFSSVALALLGTLLIGGIAAPIIVSIGSDRITVSSSSLVAAPRDSVIVTTPTPLGQSRLITLDRGFLYPADAFGRALETPLSRAQLASGGTRIVIENGYLRLRGASAGDAPGATSPLLDALADLQFESVFLRKTTVLVALPDGRTEAVTDIDGEVTHRRKSAVTLKGRGELRGQRVTFELTTGLANDPRPGTTVPLKLSIKSVLADLSFDGRANVVGAANITGAVEIKVPHVRQIARWFEAPWSNGNGLRNLQAQGQIEWAGPAIAFNRASVLIDGNEATGTLHLNFTAARPSIGGTLALKSLDLGRYFPSQTTTLPGSTSSAWNCLLATDLSLPLLQHFDADLRLSADKVVLGRLQLGRSAATVMVSQGRMLADLGAFEFDGGRGSGQLSADMTGSMPRLTLRGRLEEVDAQRLSASMFGHSVLTGRATITTDVSSYGRTGDDLFLSSNGKLNIEIRNGGRLGVDLRTLASASQRRAAEGWGTAVRGTTAFSEFNGVFAIRSGALLADDVSALSGDTMTTLSGQIDVPTSRLNATVEQIAASADSMKPATNAAPTLSLQVFGPWLRPTVRNEIGRERAADPSLPHDPTPARL
jgi:AsmA protein